MIDKHLYVVWLQTDLFGPIMMAICIGDDARDKHMSELETHPLIATSEIKWEEPEIKR